MIIFMGVAGSGKSVQGKLLADKLNLPWLSTGEFLRMLVSGERRRAMLAGELLDDLEIIAIIQKVFNLVSSNQEFILDGFPRTIPQAEWLLQQVKNGNLKITAVVHLEASRAAVKARLLSRARQDDTDVSISKRFEEYENSTKPVLDHFRESNIRVYDINGEQSPEEVHRQILETVGPEAEKAENLTKA